MYRRLIKLPWAINNAAWQRFTSKHGNINLYKKVNLTLESFRKNFEVTVETCNMFIKLILIATFVNFVCVRSIENEVQHLSLFVESHPGTIMDTESTKTGDEHVLELPTTYTSSLTVPTVTNHESIHSESAHLKKRATNFKKDHRTDLRPGCCG